MISTGGLTCIHIGSPGAIAFELNNLPERVLNLDLCFIGAFVLYVNVRSRPRTMQIEDAIVLTYHVYIYSSTH